MSRDTHKAHMGNDTISFSSPILIYLCNQSLNFSSKIHRIVASDYFDEKEKTKIQIYCIHKKRDRSNLRSLGIVPDEQN